MNNATHWKLVNENCTRSVKPDTVSGHLHHWVEEMERFMSQVTPRPIDDKEIKPFWDAKDYEEEYCVPCESVDCRCDEQYDMHTDLNLMD